MKVLGIAGSPRRGGNTDLLLDEVLRGAASTGARTRVIYLGKLKIAPCQHCDACLSTGTCAINDDMAQVYGELEEADRVVIASPVQFMGVTAQMKAMIDRCQMFWARKYVLRVSPLPPKPRKGMFVAVGGLKLKSMFDGARATVKSLFLVLDIEYAGELLFPGIDEKGAIAKQPEVLKQAYEAGRKLAEH